MLAGPIDEVLQGRSGALLWFGAIVGLWTAASFIETIRDILRRAYGVKYSASFWQYRLASMAVILGVGGPAVHRVRRDRPADLGPPVRGRPAALFRRPGRPSWAFTASLPAITLYLTFYVIFLALTPARYRMIECRKWPGAFVVTIWWLITVELLPRVIGLFGGYELTYGSLAGVMVALIFFFVIGLGVVAGAELNAALVEPGGKALRGEHYEGPYEAELPVEEPAPEEELVRAEVRKIKGVSRWAASWRASAG